MAKIIETYVGESSCPLKMYPCILQRYHDTRTDNGVMQYCLYNASFNNLNLKVNAKILAWLLREAFNISVNIVVSFFDSLGVIHKRRPQDFANS